MNDSLSKPLPVPSQSHFGAVLYYFTSGMFLVTLALLYSYFRTGDARDVISVLGGSALTVEPSELVLGDISGKQIVECGVTLQNLTDRDIRIEGCERSCGCIALEEFPFVVKAGQKRWVAIKVGESFEPGSFRYSLTFFSNSNATPQLSVWLSCSNTSI